jgi:hypothetical protein
MGWSGGSYTKGNAATGGWTGDASLGIGIEAGRHDTQDNDFATGINQCLNKDGSNSATGNLNLGGFKATNVANGTAATDAITLGQAQAQAYIWCGTSGGSANAQTLTPSPAITAYAAGQKFLFIAGATNTSAVTINVSGLGAKSIFLSETNAAATGYMIRQGFLYEIIYDGTQFIVLNQSATQHANQFSYIGQSSGTANALVLTPTIPMLAYQFGVYNFFTNATNTGAVTINISGLGAIALSTRDGQPLKAGQLQTGFNYLCYINGTNAYLLNPSRVALGWTPTITQGGAVAGIPEGYYFIDYDNKTVTVTFRFTVTGTGTAGNSVLVSLPTAMVYTPAFTSLGAGLVYDGSTNILYTGAVGPSSTTQVAFTSDSGGGNYWGVAPAIALTTNDVLSFTITYRV